MVLLASFHYTRFFCTAQVKVVRLLKKEFGPDTFLSINVSPCQILSVPAKNFTRMFFGPEIVMKLKKTSFRLAK